MATKSRSHKTTRKAAHARKSSAASNIITSAVSAAQELGAAAADFKSSWDHVKNARRRGDRATHAVTRGAKKATRSITTAARKVLPGRRTRKS